MHKLPERKNIRLKDYDYTRAGHYFITICTKEKEKLFGEIIEADDSCIQTIMKLNEIGKVACECWENINNIYQDVRTDAFCIMPNHIHGIVVIHEGGQGRPPLQKIIQGYKSVTTRQCFKYGIKNLWQRNYYDRIIRNRREYLKIYEYIEMNPLKWTLDKYYV